VEKLLDMPTLRILASSDLGATVVPLPASFGEYGTIAGILDMLERQSAVWLDVGDLVVGSPATPLLGVRPWEEVADLPIAAAAAGNHEFDDGLDALHAVSLRFPLLCANADVGLPATAMIDTDAGPLGAIGLTHPQIHLSSSGPQPADDWRVGDLADGLRRDGARWVVALLHDGVDWWPSGGGIATRSDRLEALVRPWAADVDLILAGHNFGAWTGTLAGTPAAEPYLFASSVVVAELGEQVRVRVERVPPLPPRRRTAAVEAIEAAAAERVGESAQTWLVRTGAERYLPDLLARALKDATGADAALVPPGMHGTQPPIDGAVGALRAGPITHLDLVRLLPSPEYDPVVVELRPGEFAAAVAAHDRAADPASREHDGIWWNWCRMPIGVAADDREPRTLAVVPFATRMLSEWLGRDVTGVPAGVNPQPALVAAAARTAAGRARRS
jgi:2',3'-cyclic-nucleotide 2'-phosphodiesterase (5'-nucleotidase family)